MNASQSIRRVNASQNVAPTTLRNLTQSMMNKLAGWHIWIFFFWLQVIQVTCAEDASTKKLNVLFIAIDDLRPTLGCYGDRIAITPNIDRLAKRGMTFQRAYCQQAVCSPSRLSLLTGLRPDSIRVWDLNTHFRQTKPDVITLPQHFKDNGYQTRSLGKIYHGSGKPSKDPPSWSLNPQFDVVRDPKVRYALPKNLNGKGLKRSSFESASVPDKTYIDGIVCDAAIQTLRELQKNPEPFFLAVGFRKPHLPFCAPKKYWQLYDRNQIPFPSNADHPKGAPELAVRSWKELEGYTDIASNGQLSADKIRELRHGYYACVSYIDSLVGRLIDELTTLKLADQTMIVLWGDHGFHLGEQGLWTKANNYELATRVPLIISVPQLKLAGSKSNGLVELVDIYPTLADICGLEPPKEAEGISLKPLLTKPDRPWKRAAFSQFPRQRIGHRHRQHGEIMGYAVRTDRFRYVEWQEWSSERIVAREFYDHQLDPSESRNVVDDPMYQASLKELAKLLNDGWRSALPIEDMTR